MKRALLWLGPLACLALACLYAYAWFHRDPLEVAFQRVQVGMTLEETEAVMGRPADGNYIMMRSPYRGDITYWEGEGKRNRFKIWHYRGHVEFAKVHTWPRETMGDKLRNWVSSLTSLWTPAPLRGNLRPILIPETLVTPPQEVLFDVPGYPKQAFDPPASPVSQVSEVHP